MLNNFLILTYLRDFLIPFFILQKFVSSKKPLSSVNRPGVLRFSYRVIRFDASPQAKPCGHTDHPDAVPSSPGLLMS